MIRNLVFDMGQVLMRWDPLFIASHYTDNEDEAREFMNELIVQPDWYLVDAGQIAEKDYRASLEKRAPEKWREKLLQCYDEFEIFMPPIEEMHKLAQRASKCGYEVYILSNALPRFRDLLKGWPTLQGVNGMIISAIEKVAKPDPAIYRLLLERFELTAEECVFIDDLQENIDAAEREGIHGIRFDGDMAKLREELHRLGVNL